MNETPHRILVADDERMVLEAYRHVLSFDHGFGSSDGVEALGAELFGAAAGPQRPPELDVTLCRQGDEAVAAVRRSLEEGTPFAVALLDVRMPPGIDGIQAARQIRALDDGVNIVIATAFSDIDLREIAQQIPPPDKLFHLAKPFQAPELQQLILALTARWRNDVRLMKEIAGLRRRIRTLEAEVEAKPMADRGRPPDVEGKHGILAVVGRELRRPVRVLRDLGRSLGAVTIGGQTGSGERVAEVIREQTDRLEALLDDLDTVVAPLDRKSSPDRAIVPAETVAAAIAATGVGVRTDVKGISDMPNIHGDARRIEDILIILLSWVLRRSPPQTVIRVTGDRDPVRGVLLSVGIGPDMAGEGAATRATLPDGAADDRDPVSDLVLADHLARLYEGRIETVDDPPTASLILPLHRIVTG